MEEIKFHDTDLENSNRNLPSDLHWNPLEFGQVSGKCCLRSLLSMGASSLYLKKKSQKEKKHPDGL